MAQTLQQQIIVNALALISDEANWTRGALARNKSGVVCSWDDPEAFRYCAIGALARAVADLFGPSREAGSMALRAANQVLKANSRSGYVLAHINDFEGHAAVVAMFKRALAN
jgi:hypothetical protein